MLAVRLAIEPAVIPSNPGLACGLVEEHLGRTNAPAFWFAASSRSTGEAPGLSGLSTLQAYVATTRLRCAGRDIAPILGASIYVRQPASPPAPPRPRAGLYRWC